MTVAIRKIILKIIIFLLIGIVIFSVLPQLFWNMIPDWPFFRGAAKGSFIAVVFLLLLTLVFLRNDGSSMKEVGLAMHRKRWAQLFAGIILGVIINGAIAFLTAWVFRFEWKLNPDAHVGVILTGLLLNFWSAFAEELLYRGYAFKRTVDIAGAWKAMLLFAIFFVVLHWFGWGVWGNPIGMLSVLFTVGLGGILFALAFLQTGSLALPIGLHAGFIWSNADLFTGMFARWYDNPNGLFYPVQLDYYKSYGNNLLVLNIPYLIIVVITIILMYRYRRPKQNERDYSIS